MVSGYYIGGGGGGGGGERENEGGHGVLFENCITNQIIPYS